MLTIVENNQHFAVSEARCQLLCVAVCINGDTERSRQIRQHQLATAYLRKFD